MELGSTRESESSFERSWNADETIGILSLRSFFGENIKTLTIAPRQCHCCRRKWHRQLRSFYSIFDFFFFLPRILLVAVLKYNQASRGVEGLQARMAERAATHKTWRQMKGMERVMFEVRQSTPYME